MAKKVWKAGTFIYPIPAVMVSCGDMEKSNIITVGWTGILNTDPAIVYISVRPERYSYNIIKEKKEFVINLTNEDLAFATDWCGVRSGSKFDKFSEMKLTKEKANYVEAPLIKEAPVSVECRVIEEKTYGTHATFIAEVLCINADEKYIDENGSFDISKCDLIAYANGGYYALGEKIGKFGYSVEKKKKTKPDNVKVVPRNAKRKIKENKFLEKESRNAKLIPRPRKKANRINDKPIRRKKNKHSL